LTDGDIQGYVDSLRKTGKSSTTVKIYLAHLRAMFNAAVRNRDVPLTANPCDGIKVVAKKSKRRNEGFTPEEMVLLLDKSREASPLVRISILLAAYSGARDAEVFEARREDFAEWRSRHLVFSISEDNRGEGQTVKTAESVRQFALHAAVVEEVRAYLATLPPTGPLFPMVTKRARTGKLSENAAAAVNGWIKSVTLGKTYYYFRHTFKTVCRGRVDRDVRNYIMGHKTGDVAEDYGRVPIPKTVKAMASVPADPMEWEIE
jgi:integrase